jgi:transforming growth factor-beta-induced protein
MYKRLFLLITALLLLALPVLAQDDDDDDETVTIANIVLQAASAEEAEFTTLLAALEAADPIFLEVLSDEDAGVTVFAPTDDAFAALLEAMETDAETLLADTSLLNDVLSYHIVPAEFTGQTVAALDGALLGTLLQGAALEITVEDDTAFVNDSEVIIPNQFASNGIVHGIDAVLLPPENEATEEDIAEAVEEDDEQLSSIAGTVVAQTQVEPAEFTVLLQAIENADPAVLEVLDGSGPLTVFAPTDAAFLSALDQLGLTSEELLQNQGALTAILLYHVVPGEFLAADLVGLTEAAEEDDAPSLATLLPGISFEVSIDDAGVVSASYAPVIVADTTADNGVIHIIDQVLVPPNLDFSGEDMMEATEEADMDMDDEATEEMDDDGDSDG